MAFKIAKICANFGPYHLARIAAVARQCEAKGWQVVGIELARAEEEYPWETAAQDFPCEIISIVNDSSLEKTKLNRLVVETIATLNRTAPDAIAISGYARPSMLVALLWCLWHRKPAILLSETTESDALRSGWKEAIKSWLILKFKAALVGGQPQQRYLIKLGMPADAIFLGYDVVGNQVFHPDIIKSLPNPLANPFFLAINRFVTKKNLPFLICAYADYRQLAGDRAWDLMLCGDGELRSQLETQIIELKLTEYIHLAGFLQQDRLLAYFAHAGCFIHSSTMEQWGLVINEAMAAGLPVLVSNRCGCFEDLVIEGINGFGFDPQNQAQLTNLMLKMSSGEVDLEQMGAAALTHIQNFSPDYFASGLIQSIEYANAH
jgi:1,2-diacylglycerol 3-alpha-glucosyltransferase